jgi:hypothetical protein
MNKSPWLGSMIKPKHKIIPANHHIHYTEAEKDTTLIT